jgi:hypothetical protein
MAYIQIDIDLDEFDLDEILDELEDRYGHNHHNKHEIDNFIKKMKIDVEEFLPLQNLSLINKMKLDFLINNIEQIKLEDLENLI